MSTQPINVDDADNEDIDYLTADLWNHQHGKPNYQEGTFSEGIMNAQAEFRFNGTGVMVYGVASPQPKGKQRAVPPSVSFSIDGGIPIPVVSNPDLQDMEYSHQFYDSHTLSPGEHVLHMNVTQAEDDWPFVLDYILYIPLNPVIPPSGGAAPSSQTSAAKASPHTAAIVGGVVGGIALLLAAALYLYFRKRALHMDKHGPSVNAVRKAGIAKVDLIDDDCKLPPPSPAVTAKSWDDAESLWAYPPMEFRRRSHSLSTGRHHLLASHGYQRSVSDVGSESAMNSQHSPPPTPSTSTFSHGASTRPSTPSQSVLMPPSAAYRTTHGPQIFYRPATPSESSFSHSSPEGPNSTGAGESSMAKQSEKAQLLREQRQATFHADSGVRFKSGQLLPVNAPVPVNRRPPPPPPSPEAGTSTSASLMEWKQQEQGKKRVSFGGSAISEVPPEYTPN